jgi:hypothetical protein
MREGDATAAESRDGNRLLSTAPLPFAGEEPASTTEASAVDESQDVADEEKATPLSRDDEDKEVGEGEDVYGLLRDLQADSEDPLGLAQKEQERLFGGEKGPFAALTNRDEKAKEPPPPPPVVGVRMDFGAPAYAPLVVGEDPLKEVYGHSAEAGEQAAFERPIGLNGPFTVSSTSADDVAADDLPPWLRASALATTDDAKQLSFGSAKQAAPGTASPFGKPDENLDLFAKPSANPEATAEKEKNAANAESRENLEFGLSDRTRVQLGTTPRRSSAVRSGGGETAFANSVGPLDGADRFRLQPAQEGPFGSLGNVAKVVSAYLRQASVRSEASGRVLSTLG